MDDDRESPSYHMMEKLEDHGASVDYNDPYIPTIRPTREFSKYAGRKSVRITDGYDLILISTAHDQYKEMDFSGFSSPILDTRHIIRNMHGKVHMA